MSEKYRKAARTDTKPVIDDLVARRIEWMDRLIAETPVSGARGTVGFPRAMYFHERFPFWKGVLTRMGFGVKVSPRTDKAIAREGFERTSPSRATDQVAHGHVGALRLPAWTSFSAERNQLGDGPHPHGVAILPLGADAAVRLASVPKWEKELRQIASPTAGSGTARSTSWRTCSTVRAAGSLPEGIRRIRDGYREQRSSPVPRGRGGGGDHADREGWGGAIVRWAPVNLYAGRQPEHPAKLRTTTAATSSRSTSPVDDIDIRDVNDNMFWNYGRKIIAAAKWCRNRRNIT